MENIAMIKFFASILTLLCFLILGTQVPKEAIIFYFFIGFPVLFIAMNIVWCEKQYISTGEALLRK